MKTIAKPIDMICHFNSQQEVVPLKFKYQDNEGKDVVIKVDRVIEKNKERLCGNIAWVYDCQSNINGIEKLYQLKFFVSETRWVLFKI